MREGKLTSSVYRCGLPSFGGLDDLPLYTVLVEKFGACVGLDVGLFVGYLVGNLVGFRVGYFVGGP